MNHFYKCQIYLRCQHLGWCSLLLRAPDFSKHLVCPRSKCPTAASACVKSFLTTPPQVSLLSTSWITSIPPQQRSHPANPPPSNFPAKMTSKCWFSISHLQAGLQTNPSPASRWCRLSLFRVLFPRIGALRLSNILLIQSHVSFARTQCFGLSQPHARILSAILASKNGAGWRTILNFILTPKCKNHIKYLFKMFLFIQKLCLIQKLIFLN